MGRYIEVSGFVTRLLSVSVDDSLYGMGKRAGIYKVLKILEEVPTADVAELKRGKWDDGIYCSVCGTAYDTGEYRNARNFCPNCGADMRGGRK